MMIREITAKLRVLVIDVPAAAELLDQLEKIETDAETAVAFHYENYVTPADGAKRITSQRRCEFQEKALMRYDVPRVGIYRKAHAAYERYVYPVASIETINRQNCAILTKRVEQTKDTLQTYKQHMRRKNGRKDIK